MTAGRAWLVLAGFGALVLQFTQAIDQPVSSLYYPCGIPLQEIEDYKITVRRYVTPGTAGATSRAPYIVTRRGASLSLDGKRSFSYAGISPD